MLAGKIYASDNIGNAKATCDERGPTVDHGVPDRARVIIPQSPTRISSPRRLSLNFRTVSSCKVISPLLRVWICRPAMGTSFSNKVHAETGGTEAQHPQNVRPPPNSVHTHEWVDRNLSELLRLTPETTTFCPRIDRTPPERPKSAQVQHVHKGVPLVERPCQTNRHVPQWARQRLGQCANSTAFPGSPCCTRQKLSGWQRRIRRHRLPKQKRP